MKFRPTKRHEKYKDKYKVNDKKTNTFQEHPQRAILVTFETLIKFLTIENLIS